ncbi:MAG: hypothetical protein HHAS10_06640 [Candidatus Altimarinota bacterium]
MKKNGISLLVTLVAFGIGIFFGIQIQSDNFEEKNIFVERTGTGYLVNPLIECELSTFGSNQKYIPFENDVKKRIKNEILSKNPDLQMSLYFRNLRNGPWFGIGEDEDFAPASLMKLPVAVSYMKWSEYVQEVKTFAFTGIADSMYIQNIPPEKMVIPGKLYSLNELIELSLAYSDNNANETLSSHLPRDIIYKVFNDLDLPIIGKLEAGENDYISVKEYASFFRILYNASYLSDVDSSFLLDIMTRSAMSGGIRASIPNDIIVAHKFGERRIQNADNTTYISQFHDCGIVYYADYPYIVCIMTKGGDSIPRLEKIVENASSIIFEEIRKRYK